MKLGGVLDSCGSAAYYREMEEFATDFVGWRGCLAGYWFCGLPVSCVRWVVCGWRLTDERARALLEDRQHPQPDLTSIAYVPQKRSMLSHTLDPKRLTVRAHGDNELVVGHFIDRTFVRRSWSARLAIFGRRRRSDASLADEILDDILLYADDLSRKVHIVCPALVERHMLAQAAD